MLSPLELELPLLSFNIFLFSLFYLLKLTNLEDDVDEIFFSGSKSLLKVLLWAKIFSAIS